MRYKHGLAMTTQSVTRFLRKVVADKSVSLDVSFFTNSSEWAYGAWVVCGWDNKSMTIKVNTELSDKRDLRDLLLHEVGHLKGENNHHSSQVERELSAQVWAINRAKELDISKSYARLKWELRSQWTTKHFKWNSPYRKYILANRLAKKRGLI